MVKQIADQKKKIGSIVCSIKIGKRSGLKCFLLTTIVMLIINSQISQAGDASSCVRLGNGERSQIITNTCSMEIEVVWCHNGSDKIVKSAKCNRDDRYYQKHTTLKPNQTYENQYTAPLGTTISYGACAGGYYSTKMTGKNGEYTCK